MVPHIQAVADFAREHYPSVRIGLQNHGGMLSTANQVMQVLKWIDRENVGIINDTGFYRDFLSTNATQYDWYRDIALILPYSNNFQIKKKPAGAETRGLMDLERLLRDIRKSPYRGYLPIELLWVSKDVGYPGKMEVPPYEETLQFLQRLKEAIEKTRIPETTQNTRHEEVPGISGSTLHLLEHTTPTQLCSLACLPSQAHIEVKSALGVPREALEPLEEGDRVTITSDHETRQYSVAIHRHEWVNLALINDPSRIKRSSFRGNAPVTNAFNGQAVSTSGNGHTVDASQASTAGKEQFWLAADLGAEQEIDAFGVAWGTSVGQLKKRLKGGLYRVAYTNDPAKWEALSDARQSGRRGLAGYAAPKGWEIAYSQNVSLLPDANGNKFFFQALDKPIHARYIMVTGELAAQTIEIYNFFAFDQRLAPGATRTVQLQRHDWATIRPDSPKMTLAPGRPALVERGARIPAFVVLPHRNLQLTATLLNPQGKALYRLDTTPLTAGTPFRIEPHLTASQLGTYTLQIEMQDQQLRYDAYTFTVIDEPVERYTFEHPYPAFQATKGKLNYTPDYRGNRLIDYSHAGYKGGGVAMQTPPTKIILEPSADSTGDDTERIQRAIDLIGRATPNAAGFRGTLLLKAGTYRISRPIYIAHSGIVIRGEGDGHNTIPTHDQPLSPDNWFDYTHSELPEKGVTKLVATWVADSYNKQIALFNIGGNRATEIGTAVAITDQYVPVGAQQLHVADASTFKAGDVVRITRAVNATWAHDLAMDRITDAPGVLSENQWATKERLERAYTGITQERTIASVDTKNNLLHLVEPIVDPLNSKYGTSTVATIDTTPRVAQVGIENLQLISRFNSKSRASNSAFDQTYAYYDDEQHAQVGIRLVHAEDSWVRRVTSWHLDIAVAIGSEVSRITLQDINCLEPVSGTGGERRYSFTNAGGQQVLTQRCYTRYTRHGFIVMGHVMGPNVFLDCRSDYQFDANEPHLRWSAGGLYDNVQGRIYLQNRWNNGTAHGWSGANYTLYNCDGKFIISQNPLAANYLFGRLNEADRLPFVMEEVDPGNVPNFRAHEQSLGKEMQPRSLYLAQLHDRAGSQAVVVASSCALPNPKDESKGFVEQFATLQTILLDGKPLPDFEHDCFEYHFPVALDATSLPRIEAVAAKGITIHREESEQAICFMTSKPKGLSTRYTIIPDRISKEPLSGSGSAKQLANLIDNNPTTSWSSPGTPYVQFYLGEQPIEIESVSLGYCRNTQSRRQYYFDFEVSDDGYNWHTISASEWQKDNLGKGHVMGMQLMPGVGN
ncbi:MAG: hypothetical protein IJC47_04445, partial [Alistipes sp.]|nr:hypothetical protein [Alistipes sp.]